MRTLALLGLAACAAQGDLADDCAVKAGRCAPDFTLPDTSGTDVSLSDYGGQRVIVLGTALW